MEKKTVVLLLLFFLASLTVAMDETNLSFDCKQCPENPRPANFSITSDGHVLIINRDTLGIISCNTGEEIGTYKLPESYRIANVGELALNNKILIAICGIEKQGLDEDIKEPVTKIFVIDPKGKQQGIGYSPQLEQPDRAYFRAIVGLADGRTFVQRFKSVPGLNNETRFIQQVDVSISQSGSTGDYFVFEPLGQPFYRQFYKEKTIKQAFRKTFIATLPGDSRLYLTGQIKEKDESRKIYVVEPIDGQYQVAGFLSIKLKGDVDAFLDKAHTSEGGFKNDEKERLVWQRSFTTVTSFSGWQDGFLLVSQDPPVRNNESGAFQLSIHLLDKRGHGKGTYSFGSEFVAGIYKDTLYTIDLEEKLIKKRPVSGLAR